MARVRANEIALWVKRADIADNTDPERVSHLDEDTRKRLAKKYSKSLRFLGVTETCERVVLQISGGIINQGVGTWNVPGTHPLQQNKRMATLNVEAESAHHIATILSNAFGPPRGHPYPVHAPFGNDTIEICFHLFLNNVL